MSNAWKNGSTRTHRIARAQVLQQNLIDNNGDCTVQLPGICEGKANSAHHTLGYEVTGDDIRYMVATCIRCNSAIGNPQSLTRKNRAQHLPFEWNRGGK